LVNYSEDIYRQRFSAAHEMAHAIFDADQGASVSFERPDGADLVEVRANRFASCYLMPPAFLSKLPDPNGWGDSDAIGWANMLRVSCSALAISLREAKLVDQATYARISRLSFLSRSIPHSARARSSCWSVAFQTTMSRFASRLTVPA
jgi:Zn-dependent peptidase ImmA (M78 family)